MMEIINDIPPILEKVLAAGMKPDMSRVVFTYGNKLYNPGGNPVSADLMVHEETHVGQQGEDPDGWWDEYIADTDFRMRQELEAYRNQYRFICGIEKDRERRLRHLMSFARALSGPMYGNIISAGEAMKIIKQ